MGSQDVQVRLLGDPVLLRDGRILDVGSRKQLSLIAALALEAGQVVGSDRLVEVLWADPPPAAATTLRSLLYRLRKTLGPAAESLRAQGSGCVLDLPADAVDVHRFRRLAAAGRAAWAQDQAAAAAEALREALALWRGRPFGELPAFDEAAAALEEARLDAVEDLAEAELALGRAGDALARLEPHVGAAPLRERGWAQLMLALYRLDRQADALEAYRRVHRLLDDELGVAPSATLRDLQAAILEQRADLLGPRPARESRGTGRADILAFLFTDIEASTRRWEDAPEAMAADLARHDKLLADACRAAGGTVFGHTGDGLCAAFGTAADAIAAAVAGQLELIDEPWSAGLPLLVRMAVHVGAAERRGGNYFGSTLNRTARLMSCAWGGQIVCTATAADLAAELLPEHVHLRDLGEHRLVDLARPERVFQVGHPSLPGAFAPLRAAAEGRHNLPVALTSFVGRAAELDRLDRLVTEHRLVTLVGPGGAGKTRLAVEAAGRHVGRFVDGVWFVDLAAVADSALLPHAVAVAVGLDPSSIPAGSGALDALVELLRPRRSLLVLDNCEHVVADAAALASAVLRRCPGVVVLATSRELLAVAGEFPMRLASLSLPAVDAGTTEELAGCDAVAFFCQRAAEASPGFAITDANAAAVAKICRRLDGLPLALELAAPRLRMLSAAQVADRLDDRFRLLTTGPRSAQARHRTLAATLDWSHDLLSEAERIVLRRLAVFPTDFDVTAAEAIACAGAGLAGPAEFEVLDVLDQLTDKSLLTVSQITDPGVRYRLLESVREYASAKLAAAGEEEAIRTRHRWFFVEDGYWFVDAFHGPRLHRAAVESDNVLAALESAAAAGDDPAIVRLMAQQFTYWFFSGNPNCLPWLMRAVEIDLDGEVADRALVRCGAAHVLHAGGPEHWDRAQRLLAAARALAADTGETLAQAWVDGYATQIAAVEGRFADAEDLLERSLAGFARTGHGLSEGFFGVHVSLGALVRGEWEISRAAATEALATMRRHDPQSYWIAQGLGQLALAEAALGAPERAAQAAADGVRAARELPGSRILAMALVRQAQAAVLAGDAAVATAALHELLGVLRQLGVLDWVGDALELAAIVMHTHDPTGAAGLFGALQTVRGGSAGGSGILAQIEALAVAARAAVLGRLGEARFAALVAQGAGRPLAQALEDARARV